MMQAILVPLNALLCAGICLRLLFYSRQGATHHVWISWAAYGLIVCSGSVALRIMMGVYAEPVDWAEVGINGVLCASVFAVRGNLARLFKIKSLFSVGLDYRRGSRRYKWKC